jgi:hypothetical protein
MIWESNLFASWYWCFRCLSPNRPTDIGGSSNRGHLSERGIGFGETETLLFGHAVTKRATRDDPSAVQNMEMLV